MNWSSFLRKLSCFAAARLPLLCGKEHHIRKLDTLATLKDIQAAPPFWPWIETDGIIVFNRPRCYRLTLSQPAPPSGGDWMEHLLLLSGGGSAPKTPWLGGSNPFGPVLFGSPGGSTANTHPAGRTGGGEGLPPGAAQRGGRECRVRLQRSRGGRGGWKGGCRWDGVSG